MNMGLITLFTIPLALIIAMTHTPVAGQQAGATLDDYLWKNRPLLVFAPAPTTPAYRRIAADIADRMAQIVDRDMVIIAVFETGRVTVDDVPASGLRADDLRRQFGAPPGATAAMLIGKDGGLKLKQIGRFDLAEIFALIDTMPMRQREMRNKTQ